jgi:hypothetical protein
MQGHPKYEPMLKELRQLFDAHNVSGRVSMDYLTRMYFGRLAS